MINDSRAAVSMWTRLKYNLLPGDEDRRRVTAKDLGLPLSAVRWSRGDLEYLRPSGLWAKAVPAIGDAPLFENDDPLDMLAHPGRSFGQWRDMHRRIGFALDSGLGEILPGIGGTLAGAYMLGWPPDPKRALAGNVLGAAATDWARQLFGHSIFLPEQIPAPDWLNIAGHGFAGVGGEVTARLLRGLLAKALKDEDLRELAAWGVSELGMAGVEAPAEAAGRWASDVWQALERSAGDPMAAGSLPPRPRRPGLSQRQRWRHGKAAGSLNERLGSR
ncbi:hypothetical protein ACFOGJ_28710 [Marinibaculum pumilum]|uniref:Uncharacterized protein n=1 Tax=Marinibaculum pumilum TaxID=1766165 RepID=A0ABV7L9V8_9PROT